MKKFTIHTVRHNRRIVRAFLRSNTDLKRSDIRAMPYHKLMKIYSSLLFIYNMSKIYWQKRYFFNFKKRIK